MNWKCPEDWKYIPEAQDADDGLLMASLFAGRKRFKQIRAPWFRRCNASGRWIWPLQKGWHGVVGIDTGDRGLDKFGRRNNGKFIEVWLNNDQYIIQKLKSNI